MGPAISDYALLGDTHTAALVSKQGSIDWLCAPDFDSGACFAALLGTKEHGTWTLCPVGTVRSIERRYIPETLILETTLKTDDGAVRLVEFMPCRSGKDAKLVRMVEGIEGRVEMAMLLTPSFDYGSIQPWIEPGPPGCYDFVAGPDALRFFGESIGGAPLPCTQEAGRVESRFFVAGGDRVALTLEWYPSDAPAPERLDTPVAQSETLAYWRKWASQYSYNGRFRDPILRSVITLKALTYAPTGAIVAAPTTSLPELIGGERNWDYRYSWLRDGAWTLLALLRTGFRDEAEAFRDWLYRAVAGDPARVKIMYGIRGERRLDERILEWLPGFADSPPVRIGNGAHGQVQLDVFGELIASVWAGLRAGVTPHPRSEQIMIHFLQYLEDNWDRTDEGIWEIRGPARHFTHSKIMAWQAFRLGAQMARTLGWNVDPARWEAKAEAVRERVLKEGYNEDKGAFVQYFGGTALDASLLGLPNSRFLPGDDPRVASTVDAIHRELGDGDFVYRYELETGEAHVDGLAGGEGAFLGLSFVRVDALCRIGRLDDAQSLYERLLLVANDVGLYSEEYDPATQSFLGNFPQALSHTALVNAGLTLDRALTKQR